MRLQGIQVKNISLFFTQKKQITMKSIHESIEETYKEIDACLRVASVSQLGGFRPPEDKITSWFGGHGVGLAHEQRPQYKGRDMFCLLQVKLSELPYVPDALKGIEFLVVFFNRDEMPFDKPHGEGWEIRTYTSLDGLTLLPPSQEDDMVKDFPIRWNKVTDDAPDWENAWEIVDLSPINDTEGADEKFFYDYNRYTGTKFGGYPCCIQHGHELDGFIFQIGSEEKAQWMWADNGIAYFNKNADGEWTFECQFY